MLGFWGINKKEDNGKKISYSSLLGIIVISVTIIAGLFFVLSDTNKQSYLSDVQIKTLSNNWTTPGGEVFSLPLKMNDHGDSFFSFETTLTKFDHIKHPTLMFQGKYINTNIYLDDILVDSYQSKPEGASHTIGETYLFVSLPPNYDGMKLRMDGNLLLGSLASYKIFPPLLGNQAHIFYQLISSELPTMIAVIVVISTGILLLIFSLQARCTSHGSSYFYTSLFSILFALYTLFCSQTIYFFCPSGNFIYFGEFASLCLLPLPLLILLYYKTTVIFQRILTVNIILVTLNFAGIILLHLFTPYEFRTTLTVTHIVMLLSLIDIVITILFGSKTKKERLGLLITFSPIFVGTVGQLTLFYLPVVYDEAFYAIVCVFLFIVMQAYHLIRSYLHIWKENIQSALYQHLAYTDALTKLGNRTAFEEKINQLNQSLKEKALETIWCICADVNGLKQVNDTLGHAMGDQLLCLAASNLQSILFDNCYLYRTGGDEFIIFAINCSEEMVQSALDKLQVNIAKVNENSSIELSIATGYDKLRDGGTDTVEGLLKRSDALMYEKKRSMKTVC